MTEHLRNHACVIDELLEERRNMIMRHEHEVEAFRLRTLAVVEEFKQLLETL